MIHPASLHSLSHYYLLTHCTSSSQLCPYLFAPSLPPSHPHLAELICNEISSTFSCVVRLPANSHSQTEHFYPWYMVPRTVSTNVDVGIPSGIACFAWFSCLFSFLHHAVEAHNGHFNHSISEMVLSNRLDTDFHWLKRSTPESERGNSQFATALSLFDPSSFWSVHVVTFKHLLLF